MVLRALLPQVEAGERVRFLGACVGFMCVASASLIARIAGDTLFLSAYGRDFLSYMYIGTALVVGLLSYAFGTYVRQVSLSRIIIVACGLLAVCSLGLGLALAHPWGGCGWPPTCWLT